MKKEFIGWFFYLAFAVSWPSRNKEVRWQLRVWGQSGPVLLDLFISRHISQIRWSLYPVTMSTQRPPSSSPWSAVQRRHMVARAEACPENKAVY